MSRLEISPTQLLFGFRIARYTHARVAWGLTRKGAYPTRQGDKVRFRVSDVFLPSQEELPTELSQSAGAEMEGEIVDFSDSGLEPRVFAVVEISGSRTLVIPVSKLAVVEANPEPDR